LLNCVGSLVRVGPKELCTDDPEIIRTMWAVRSPYKRAAFYEAVKFDPSRDNLATMRDDTAHSALKAKMAPGVGVAQISIMVQR
jgi:hypothetical protein